MRTVRIGLLGSGTVGEAVQDLVLAPGAGAAAPAGLRVEIAKIFTRRPAAKKWYARSPALFTARAEEVLDRPEVDVIVEVLGAEREGDLELHRDYVLRALENGKHVVTSDKAVLARFGREIWEAAAKHGRQLRFEACVGGGIPIVRSLIEGFAAERPDRIFGIINGTCNYVLTRMAEAGCSYAEALAEAQKRGYAESDPSADVSGRDAEAKLILLVAVAFGFAIAPGRIWRRGIEGLHGLDFVYAARKASCTIKHLAVAERSGGSVTAFVSPVLLPADHFAARVPGATNAIFFDGRLSRGATNGASEEGAWNYAFIGPGAGGGPTAVAVLGDVYDIARGRELPWRPAFRPEAMELAPEGEIVASFYVRFLVRDRAGIVGDICQIFGTEGIHISEVWQLEHSAEELSGLASSLGLAAPPRQLLPFVVTLERARVAQVRRALEAIGQRDFNLAPPLWMPIWRVRG
jgi:homoserine dehydrogenase